MCAAKLTGWAVDVSLGAQTVPERDQKLKNMQPNKSRKTPGKTANEALSSGTMRQLSLHSVGWLSKVCL